MYKLSIVICTWNRPTEINRCINSIITNKRSNLISEFEIIVVDDGQLPDSLIKEINSKLEQTEYFFKYIKKNNNRGTFFSRILGIDNAKGDIVLFIDDDAEMEKDYLNILLKTYQENPNIIGVGGVDVLLSINIFQKVYYKLFLLSSPHYGKLSLSGFCNSYLEWKYKIVPFFSEFLIGHNMSFKKQMIPQMPVEEWLRGYCPGEDIYISYFMGKRGTMMVNPNLRIKHHSSSLAREMSYCNHRKYLVNFFYLLSFKKRTPIKHFAFVWTTLGLILRSILKLNLPELRGYILGVKDIFRILIIR